MANTSRTALTLLILLLASAITSPTKAQVPAASCSSCSVVQGALGDLQHLRVGMTRRDVERYFVLGAGMNARTPTTYVYRSCDYLQVQIEFNFDPAVDRNLSPKDTITKISKLVVDYPSRD